MSFRRFSPKRRRRSGLGSIVNSEKNIIPAFTAVAAGATIAITIAIAVNAADNTTINEVTRRCKLKAIWMELWVYDSAEIAVGTTTGVDAYIWKNPGANLTAPTPGTVGSSNEKKFVFKSWKGLTGPRTQGSLPYTWKGWIKIPPRYQRMGTDDLFQFVLRATGSAQIVCTNFIYKWYQ